MHLKSKALPAVLAALGGGLATPAVAAGSASCALSATPLAFGQYVLSRSTPADLTATLTLTCTGTGANPESIVGTIALAGVNGPSGSVLSDGSHRLRYRLHSDPGRTKAWGDGTGVGVAQSFFGDGRLVGSLSTELHHLWAHPSPPVGCRCWQLCRSDYRRFELLKAKHLVTMRLFRR